MIREDSYKSKLSEAKQNYKEVFINIDEYTVDNYFTLRGVCKTIIPGNPFLKLKGDCLEVLVSRYLISDLFKFVGPEAEMNSVPIGQDSHLG